MLYIRFQRHMQRLIFREPPGRASYALSLVPYALYTFSTAHAAPHLPGANRQQQAYMSQLGLMPPAFCLIYIAPRLQQAYMSQLCLMPLCSALCLMPYALCLSAVALALAHTVEEAEREELSLKLRFAVAYGIRHKA